METHKNQMQKRIEQVAYGSAFVVSDFTDIMDYGTAKRTLARLEENGTVRRVLRGVYDKPRYSSLLHEYASPDPDQIAQAIARNMNWTIAPSGNAALNILGLSTQVPANWCYISTGPYRSYQLETITIEFRHRADKTIAGMSYISATVIEALKAIGKDQVDDTVIYHLQKQLTEEQKELLLIESRQTTSWIYQIIKEICKESGESVAANV